MGTQNLLNEGLQKGFGGDTDIKKTNRGGFNLTSSHYDNGKGGVYHDEWVTGGGQELVRTQDGEAMTRTYVGNVIAPEKLEELGISEKDVMTVLKRVITEHGEQIRLGEDFGIILDDWRYTYKVTYRREDPYIINGIEEIFYQDQSVFVHTFGISKVVES